MPGLVCIGVQKRYGERRRAKDSGRMAEKGGDVPARWEVKILRCVEGRDGRHEVVESRERYQVHRDLIQIDIQGSLKPRWTEVYTCIYIKVELCISTNSYSEKATWLN